MQIYNFFVDLYNQTLAVFPANLQWVVTLLILIGFTVAFVALIRKSIIFVVVLVLLLPFLIPVVGHFFGDLDHVLLFLIQSLAGSAPKP